MSEKFSRYYSGDGNQKDSFRKPVPYNVKAFKIPQLFERTKLHGKWKDSVWSSSTTSPKM